MMSNRRDTDDGVEAFVRNHEGWVLGLGGLAIVGLTLAMALLL